MVDETRTTTTGNFDAHVPVASNDSNDSSNDIGINIAARGPLPLNQPRDLEAELDNLLGEPGRQAIDGGLPTIVTNNDDGAAASHDLETMISLALVKELTQVDLTMIHCSKTGQPIAAMNEYSLQMLMRLHSVSKLEQIASELDLASGVHPVWVKTGPEQLNRLQRIDPRGFFTYCVGIALQDFHMPYSKAGRKDFATIEGRRAFRNSLVQCWYETARFSDSELHEANKHLRFFMFLQLWNKKYYRVPWHMIRAPKVSEFEKTVLSQKLAAMRGLPNNFVSKTYSEAEVEVDYTKVTGAINPDPNAKTGTKIKVEGEHGKLDTRRILNAHGLQWNRPREESEGYREAKENEVINEAVFSGPLLPHEFATAHGVAWIKSVLASTLRQIQTKMRIDDIMYKNLPTAQAFRPSGRYDDDVNYIAEMVGETGLPTYRRESKREVSARAQKIKEARMHTAQQVDAKLLAELNLTVVGGTLQVSPLPASQTEVKQIAQDTSKPVATVSVPGLAGLFGKK